MSTDILTPPVDLMGDFETLHDTIVGDASGEKTRRFVEYFERAEMLTLEMKLRTADPEQKSFAGMVAEAFAASHRIVVAAWQLEHGRELG
jgi:hypothetical protein